MAGRYSQIKRGAEYSTGLDNYITYLRNAETRPTKRLQGGTRGARRQTVPAAVLPFGMAMEAGEYAAVRVSTSSQAGLGSALTNRLFTTGANLSGATRIGGFRAARVTGFSGNGAAAYKKSKVTQLYYLSYDGDTYSAPFGAITETEEEAEGYRLVRAGVLAAFGAADIKRISFAPEKVPG